MWAIVLKKESLSEVCGAEMKRSEGCLTISELIYRHHTGIGVPLKNLR
jgi:hypothetical protein